MAARALVLALFLPVAFALVLRDPTVTLKAEKKTHDSYRAELLEGCGEVCDTSMAGKPGKYFNEVSKHIDCMGIYKNVQDDALASSWPPPQEIPGFLAQDYTMGGTVPTGKFYWEERYSGTAAKTTQWTTALIDSYISQARNGTLPGTYGVGATANVRQMLLKHADAIKGKSFQVIGSESPWVEALLLDAGAKHVTTVDYGKIGCSDPRVDTMTPAELREKFLASGGREPKFDGAATFSSVEHSGLGRYGDALNPWGDLQAMAKVWCTTEVNGPLFLGVPTGEDMVEYNAHRVYGAKRYPQLTANWRQVDKGLGDNRTAPLVGQDGNRTNKFQNQPVLLFTRGEGA